MHIGFHLQKMLAALTVVLLSCAAAQAAEPYRLNAGDVLLISVWKEEHLQREVVVLPDGTITFPLAGHMPAAGLSPQQLQDALHKRLKAFFADPVITVSVVAVTGNKIYVLGQVNNPGEFQANRPIDVIQALSLAGGLTTFAAENAIKVLRRDASGNQRAFDFRYADISRGRNLESNILLQSGDIVLVPTSGLF